MEDVITHGRDVPDIAEINASDNEEINTKEIDVAPIVDGINTEFLSIRISDISWEG